VIFAAPASRQKHDPEKACPALDAGCVAAFLATNAKTNGKTNAKGVCAEIMLNQRAKAR
jgi:hypothetical protein